MSQRHDGLQPLLC